MKGYKIMIYFAIVVLVLIVVMIGIIMFQNNKPQTEIGVKDEKFYELSNKPNGVSTQTKDVKKLVEPLPFKSDLEASKKAILSALIAYGNIEIKIQDVNYIYAISTTSKMKFKDDLEFYFDEKTAEIHFRSASRAGYSDMGLNRERYE